MNRHLKSHAPRYGLVMSSAATLEDASHFASNSAAGSAMRKHLLVFKPQSASSNSGDYHLDVPVAGFLSHFAKYDHYSELFGAIQFLAEEADFELDSEGIDEATAIDASKVLALIENFDVSPPRVFSHSGKAVVFTWDLPRVNRYLTVSKGKVSVFDVDRVTRDSQRYPASDIEDDKIGTFMKALGKPHAASSSD